MSYTQLIQIIESKAILTAFQITRHILACLLDKADTEQHFWLMHNIRNKSRTVEKNLSPQQAHLHKRRERHMHAMIKASRAGQNHRDLSITDPNKVLQPPPVEPVYPG